MYRTIRQIFLMGLALTPVPGIVSAETRVAVSEPGSADAQDFATSDEAVKTLLDVARSGDPKQAAALFGARGAEIFSSGDEIADKNHRRCQPWRANARAGSPR